MESAYQSIGFQWGIHQQGKENYDVGVVKTFVHFPEEVSLSQDM